MKANATALHGGADCLLVRQEWLKDVPVNAVDYAAARKTVCGKNATVRGVSSSFNPRQEYK
jgi:hypothetical protein